MKVEELMNRTVCTCRPTDSLNEASQAMWDRDLGSLVVIDDEGKAIGVVTDRDLLMCAYLNGKALGDETVSRAMSRAVHSVRIDEPVRAAEVLMKEKQVRRLVVLDHDGRIAGILSLNDLALAAGPKKEVKPEAVVAALASICQPRSRAALAQS